MDNKEVSEVFDRIAGLLEIKGEAVYRVLAYRRAGESLRALSGDLTEIWQDGKLEQVPGVGKAIASKIDELLRTGKLEFYDRLTAEVPESLLDLLKVSDVGPKKAARFWKELGITTVEELEKAAREGKLQQLSGMGERSEERILEGIESLKRRQTDRILLGDAWPLATALLEELKKISTVEDAVAAGSLRRWQETVGDLDLLVASSDPERVMKTFLDLPEISRVRSQGQTKASVEMGQGIQVQIWVHPPERFGSALQYATGSQAHNVRLRELARQRDLSLSEHGFKRPDGTEILCAEEAAVYENLGLPWIPPELREDRGEIQAAQEGNLPRLVGLSDLKGELHAHSDWSDGQATIEAMAEAAVRAGMTYLAITDHSRSLGIANGLSIERLDKQRHAIEAVQQDLGDRLHLLHGTEVEVLADGSIDYPDEILAKLDIVFASVHTSLRQPRAQISERFLSAIRNPHVDVIGHLSGRLIGKREGADLDVDRILSSAAKYGVALEINADPARIDLNDIHAQRALEFGCRLAICTDAHRPEHLGLRIFALGTARRAWATKDSILNTWSLEKLQDWLRTRK